MTAIKTFLPLILIAFASIVITVFGSWQILSAFAVGFAKFVAAIIVVWYVDNFLVPNINTREKLNENSIAYGLFFLGLCVLAAYCFGAA